MKIVNSSCKVFYLKESGLKQNEIEDNTYSALDDYLKNARYVACFRES